MIYPKVAEDEEAAEAEAEAGPEQLIELGQIEESEDTWDREGDLNMREENDNGDNSETRTTS